MVGELKLKIIFLFITIVIFSPSYGYALYNDPGYNKVGEEGSLYKQEVYRRDREKFFKEKKRLLKAAIPQREKKKETLTPFTYNLSKEQQMEFLKKKRKVDTLSSKETIQHPLKKKQPDKSILLKIVLNVLVVVLCVIGFGIFIRRIRP
ncbi:hypothetical protein MNBD_UNCLBAC01-162 [hydrothermal vent metagenome]|uniref:Uncharacterized protein n=1 Tax=hydrothermal vent metagenome TaxID=652676 RepID=A0A3B1DNS3_9ZZZZ